MRSGGFQPVGAALPAAIDEVVGSHALMRMDRATRMDEIRPLMATPQVVVGSVAAVTETGSVLAASASGSQIPAYGGGAAQRIWVVGAQKVVPDLDTAPRRIETYSYPLEDARTRAAYGQPSAVNEVLIVNGEPDPGPHAGPAAAPGHRLLIRRRTLSWLHKGQSTKTRSASESTSWSRRFAPWISRL